MKSSSSHGKYKLLLKVNYKMKESKRHNTNSKKIKIDISYPTKMKREGERKVRERKAR